MDNENLQQDWPWAGWGLGGSFVALMLPCLATPLFMVGGGTSLDTLLICLTFLACAVLGWKIGIEIGRKRNFGTPEGNYGGWGFGGMLAGMLVGIFGPGALSLMLIGAGCLTPGWVFPFLTGFVGGCMFLGWRLGVRFGSRRAHA